MGKTYFFGYIPQPLLKMNTPTPGLVRLSAKPISSLIAALVFLPLTTFAQTTWYLNQSQPFGNSWSTPADWSANPGAPLGASPSSISNQDIFNTNGKILRTVNGATSVFGGARLDLNSQLSVKASTVSIGNLKTLAGAYIAAQDADNVNDKTLILNVTNFNATAETRFAATTSNNRSLAINITTLTGSGDLILGKSGGGTAAVSTLTFQAATATAFTGNIHLFGTGTTLAFTQNLVSGGGLTLETGSILTLAGNRNLTFTSLTIGGTALAANTYTFAQLNSDYDAYFADGGSGSITIIPIPEPAAYAVILTLIAAGRVMMRRRKTSLD